MSKKMSDKRKKRRRLVYLIFTAGVVVGILVGILVDRVFSALFF